jgi:hypothetical protein
MRSTTSVVESRRNTGSRPTTAMNSTATSSDRSRSCPNGAACQPAGCDELGLAQAESPTDNDAPMSCQALFRVGEEVSDPLGEMFGAGA